MKKKNLTKYEIFRNKIHTKLKQYKYGLTWHEIRQKTNLPQTVPYNGWVMKLEEDIGLQRVRDARGMVWVLVNCR